MFKISNKSAGKQESYSKVYLKLIGLEFNTTKIQKAKDHYKQVYKQLTVDTSGRAWVLNDRGDKMFVQVSDLYEEPKQTIKIVHDEMVTLVYSKEQFKLKEGDVSIAKCETGMEQLE